MVAVEQKCSKCGCNFLRGIYPQSTCDSCSNSEKVEWINGVEE